MRLAILDALACCGVLAVISLPLACSPAPTVDDIQAFVAPTGLYSIMAAPPAPAPPAPAPKPGDACPTCRGAGVVGDGVVRMTCQDCGGTGKVPKSVLVAPTCKDGKCQNKSGTAR
jgi:hypothetical protein